MSEDRLTIHQSFILGGEEESDREVIALPIPLNYKRKEPLPDVLPVMALRNTVLFPGAVMPITVGRAATKALIKNAVKAKIEIVAAAQKDPTIEEPVVSQLYEVATVAQIVKVVSMPDGTQTVILHGTSRVILGEQTQETPYLEAHVTLAEEEVKEDKNSQTFKALIGSLKDSTIEMFRYMDGVPTDIGMMVKTVNDNKFLVNFIAANLDLKVEEKQRILSENSITGKAQLLLKSVEKELEFLRLKNEIQSKAREGIDKQQREYMLNEQLRTIQHELGADPHDDQIKKYQEAAKKKKWAKSVQEVFDRELARYSRISSSSPDHAMAEGYLESLLSLPWEHVSKDNMDLKRAEKKLNSDHYGLDKVKERILEHLAVLKLKGDLKSPILCLYGPPGVGKTSLGKSVAEALGRKYVRMSLGGLHDEAEIRGHRRTYIGAMMGRILECIKQAGTSNPVFVLDEIDKVSSDFHGDPASALLEVLDPEQNTAFHDNYLDVDYDLSKVMFIATANNTSTIASPLLDRMELIPVDGYLLEEKVEIATKHLLPKQMKAHGIPKGKISVSKKVMTYIVEKYTRESGVRQLDKTIATLCRKIALKIAKDDDFDKNVSQEDVRTMLGVERFDHDVWQDDLRAGVVTGLAWTAVGGEILFVECAISEGKGKMSLTGNLGDVMKESAMLAVEYLRSNAAVYGIQDVNFDERNFHIHVPEGAVPKDGPSAGITMVTAVVSAMTGRKVRKRVAMTGEITLRGKVLPVGGITEKILAAKRAGIKEIILCEQNKKDISEIKPEYIEGLTFHYVTEIPQVIDFALEK
ncbi:MAG: endopeptidase La [Bacteroidales bacterium]|nr:endopeptidase La [Bacteroidales bacterium]